MTMMSMMSTRPRAQEEGSRVQQWSQPRQTDDELSLLELKVMQRKWCDDSELDKMDSVEQIEVMYSRRSRCVGRLKSLNN
jgi:hypothetical protein